MQQKQMTSEEIQSKMRSLAEDDQEKLKILSEASRFTHSGKNSVYAAKTGTAVLMCETDGSSSSRWTNMSIEQASDVHTALSSLFS